MLSDSTLRLNVSYHGAHFCGYQSQINGRTVEDELKLALKRITGESPVLIAAGRTDAGVHARHQAISLKLATKLSLEKLTKALAALLPKDISVWRIDKMPDGFDARRQSIGKQYIYQIFEGLSPDPFLRDLCLHVRSPLNIEAMNNAAAFLIGEHDFSSFRASACTALHARRYLWHLQASKIGGIINVDVRGNAFCLNMVRIMVGTLLEVGQNKRKPDVVKDILAAKDRKLAGITAKPHGLILNRIYYPDDLAEANIPEDAVFPRFPITNETWPFLAHEIELGPGESICK